VRPPRRGSIGVRRSSAGHAESAQPAARVASSRTHAGEAGFHAFLERGTFRTRPRRPGHGAVGARRRRKVDPFAETHEPNPERLKLLQADWLIYGLTAVVFVVEQWEGLVARIRARQAIQRLGLSLSADPIAQQAALLAIVIGAGLCAYGLTNVAWTSEWFWKASMYVEGPVHARWRQAQLAIVLGVALVAGGWLLRRSRT
jgi:hypothetical protein